MPTLDPSLSRRISDCARAVQIAKTQMEKARTPEERFACLKDLERAEQEMDQAAMTVNRGLERV